MYTHTSIESFLTLRFILFFDQIFFTRCFPRGRPSFGVIIPSLFEIHPALPAVSEGNSIRRFVDFCCRRDVHFFSAVILRSRAPAAGFKHLLVFFNFFRARRARGEWKKSERKALLRGASCGKSEPKLDQKLSKFVPKWRLKIHQKTKLFVCSMRA